MRERLERVQGGKRACGSLELGGVKRDHRRHLAQQLLLAHHCALARVQHDGLLLLEIRGDVSLRADQRLLALIAIGHPTTLCVRNFNVVAENTVVADAQ